MQRENGAEQMEVTPACRGRGTGPRPHLLKEVLFYADCKFQIESGRVDV